MLSVVDLNKIELATEEDKFYGIDYWARIFKAKTWEELKMWAENDEYLKEAADSLYKANADEIVRQQCRAREDAERRERTLERNVRILTEANKELRAEKQELQKDKKLLSNEIEMLRKRVEELEKRG